RNDCMAACALAGEALGVPDHALLDQRGGHGSRRGPRRGLARHLCGALPLVVALAPEEGVEPSPGGPESEEAPEAEDEDADDHDRRRPSSAQHPTPLLRPDLRSGQAFVCRELAWERAHCSLSSSGISRPAGAPVLCSNSRAFCRMI